jgi:hypothetical protein
MNKKTRRIGIAAILIALVIVILGSCQAIAGAATPRCPKFRSGEPCHVVKHPVRWKKNHPNRTLLKGNMACNWS